MERLKLERQADYRRLLNGLRAEQVAMMPTDTVFGLSARADSERAAARIFKINKRDPGKALLVLVSSLAMARRYCHINRVQAAALAKIWSGKRPTTVILVHRHLLPSKITAGSRLLAVRLPKSDFLRKIIRSLGVPLISTSANLSGQPTLDVAAALIVFKRGAGPDIIIEGKVKSKRASRLIKLDSQGRIEILRK